MCLHPKPSPDPWPMTCWVNDKGVIVGVRFGYSAGDEHTLENEAQALLAAKPLNGPLIE